jgi:hypothetical protein
MGPRIRPRFIAPSALFRHSLAQGVPSLIQIVPLRASSHHANTAMQARLAGKLKARQNVLRFRKETILQRDNPVRKFPNWRNRFEASNVS